MYFLVYDFSRFHYNNFRDTTSWECIVTDDCIASYLIEFESFTLTKLYIDPITPCLGVFSTYSACTMQDVVWSSQACTDLCVPCPIGFSAVRHTVCLSLLGFCPPGIHPEFVMECKLIAHPI